MDIKTRKTMKD